MANGGSVCRVYSVHRVLRLLRHRDRRCTQQTRPLLAFWGIIGNGLAESKPQAAFS